MSNHTILVCDNFGKEFLNRLSEFGKVLQSSDIDYNLPVEEVTVLVVRSKTKVNKTTVDVMKKLECVITATHGLDHIDQPYLAERGISFYNVPAQSYDVAQGVIAYILAHATNLVEGDRSMKQGQWKKASLIGCRVTGKTLGVVGCGKIGREVARIGCALGMNVVVFDPCIADDGTIYVVSKGFYDDSSACYLHAFGTVEGNNPPEMQMLDGTLEGEINTHYKYSFSASDPDNNPVGYLIDWGDGTTDGWTMDYAPWVTVSLWHAWNEEDNYTIKVKARDSVGEESDWVTLEVTMPKNKDFNFNFNLLSWLLERFPILQKILDVLRLNN